MCCHSKAKASPRGRASYRRAKASAAPLFLWEPRPAANAEVLPAQKQKLRPEVGPPTRRAKASAAPLFFVGGAPRGECGMCCHSKAKLRPEVGPPTRRAKASAAPLFFVGRHAPRRMRRFCQLKSKSFAPGRASYRRAKASAAPLFLWEPRPAANVEVLPAQSKSFAPRSGLLQKRQKRHPHRFFCGRCDPRRMRCAATQKQKLRPEVGPPTGRANASAAPLFFVGRHAPRRMRDVLPLKSKVSPRGRASYRKSQRVSRTAFGEARPAANAGCAATQKQSFAPRSGLLQKSQSFSRTAFFVGAAPRGECGDSASSKQKLRPEVGPPTRRANASAAPLFCGRRDPRRMRGFYQLKAKASPRGRASYKKSQSATRAAFLWEPRPAANAMCC